MRAVPGAAKEYDGRRSADAVALPEDVIKIAEDDVTT
jgi:hypothetical protein